MAQLVFVHGVANRDTPEYRQAVVNRQVLFCELLFQHKNVTFHSPMWGEFVPSIPTEVFATNDKGVGTFSLNVGVGSGLGGGLMGGAKKTGASDISIGAIGKQDPVAALDAICSQMVDRAVAEKRPFTFEELHAFRTAVELMNTDKADAVFNGDASPQSIVGVFNATAPTPFSITSMIGDAVSVVTDRVRNTLSTLGFNAIRGNLSPAIGLFMSDVFVYLKDGEVRRSIQKTVREALITAHDSAKGGGGPLVVVGHSMGGVILVDMLTDPQSAGLPDGLSVDALLTVGSQPGFFAALDLVALKRPRHRPDCVKHWLNVFDPIDPLAFRSDMIFEGVTDLEFNSLAGIAEAHSKYFQRPQFYARTRKRLQEFNVL